MRITAVLKIRWPIRVDSTGCNVDVLHMRCYERDECLFWFTLCVKHGNWQSIILRLQTVHFQQSMGTIIDNFVHHPEQPDFTKHLAANQVNPIEFICLCLREMLPRHQHGMTSKAFSEISLADPFKVSDQRRALRT
jgi:hypothetical protein